ncbi:transcription repressor NadR [Alicyclobacillus mengziensis]|nr:transcription repressor NadR [Alicyclobacillus mengziensis]
MPDRKSRQERMLAELSASTRPLTGTELAERCGVTRQVVVHDVAILRAAGVNIISTPRGYWVQTVPSAQTTVLSVCHTPELTEVELMTLVDFGIEVVDVIVEHPLYGELRGQLHLSSRRDVELFLENVASSDALLLSSLTEGFHLHTVAAPTQGRLLEAIQALRARGIEVFEED